MFALTLSSFTVNDNEYNGLTTAYYLDANEGLTSALVRCDSTSTSNPRCTIEDSEGEDVLVYCDPQLINALYKCDP